MSFRHPSSRQMYRSYRSDEMESASPTYGFCGRRSNYLLGAGILLALIGASLLVAFGLLYVQPYIDIRHLVESKCTTETALAGDTVSCTCASDASGSCTSHYPCIHIFVNYTVESNDDVVYNATLYDSYETYILQSAAQQCSFHKCDRVVQNNVAAVHSFAERYGDPGTKYVCFSNPSDATYVILDVVTKATVVHCMFWPLLSLVVGLSIVLVYVFHVDTRSHRHEDNDTSSPLPSSLERRLVRVGDRTMILSGEEQVAQ